MNMSNKEIKEIASGGYSAWLDKETLAIAGKEKITIFNVVSLQKLKENKFQLGFSPAKFAFGLEENIYFEDMTQNPDLDISVLNTVTGKRSVIIEDARNPSFHEIRRIIYVPKVIFDGATL